MKINIEVIPHSEQLYDTAGNWFLDDAGVLQIRISRMKDPVYTHLVALHELVEALVESMKFGDLVPPQWLILQTDQFDQTFEKQRHKNDYASEPGYSNGCPVYQGHMLASAVEHLAAMLLKIDYNDYQKAIGNLK